MQPKAGYPHTLEVAVTYSLSGDGLRTQFEIQNKGSAPAPVGAGFHPYFCGVEGTLRDWVVRIPAAKYLEMDGVLSTGRVLDVEGSKCDFRSGRKVEETKYNDCVCDLQRDESGWATASLSSATSRVTIKMDRSFEYVVVYTGDQIPQPDARKAFAIEPMTCGPNAFNEKSWGLRTLAPGEAFKGEYLICADDAF